MSNGLKRNDKGQFLPKNGGGGLRGTAAETRNKMLKALKRNDYTEAGWLDETVRRSKVDKTSRDFINKALFPTYKPEQKPIKFNIQGDTLVEKATNILEEVGKGKLSIENGVQLLRALKELGSLIEFEQIAEKLAKLESQIAEGFTKLTKEEEDDEWD